MSRRWRCAFALALLGCSLIWSAATRAQTSAAATAALATLGTLVSADAMNLAELEARYRRPEELARLCDAARSRNLEMDDRHKALEHTETAIAYELDQAGKTVAAEKGVDLVWFEKGDEFRQTLEKTDLDTGKAKRFDRKAKKSPKSDTIYPLTREAPTGAYAYQLEACEMAGGRPLLRVAFEPQEPLAGKMRGKVWIDPVAGQATRFDGEVVVLPRFVDETRIAIEFGPAENEQIQTRRAVIHVSGGVALIKKRYRFETDHHGYQPHVAR